MYGSILKGKCLKVAGNAKCAHLWLPWELRRESGSGGILSPGIEAHPILLALMLAIKPCWSLAEPSSLLDSLPAAQPDPTTLACSLESHRASRALGETI